MSLDALFTNKSKVDIQGLKDLYAPYDLRNVVPGAMVGTDSSFGPNTYGGVYRAMPSVIALNPRANYKDAPHVLPHEYEHVLQNNVDSRYKQNNTNWDNEFIKQSKIPVPQLKAYLQKSAKDKSIPLYMQDKYKFPIKYFGAMEDGDYSLREQLAEISAAESFLKKDLTRDPFIRKTIFNDDPNFIKAYRATTGLRTNRLDAKDLPPMTVK